METTSPSFPDYYKEGMPGYVLRDWEIIDYECYELDGTGLWFRGPAPEHLEEGRYFTAIGAAQTFGCFCPRPYPSILAERLGIEGLNLGYSGAGPSFFLQRPELLQYINRSAFCIVQAMSGRSTSNSLLDNQDGLAYGKRRSDGAIMAAGAAFGELLDHELARIPIPDGKLKALLLWCLGGLPLPSVRKVVRESRRNWIRDSRALMQAITVPKIFFWFSKRTPFYFPRYHPRTALFGGFPQLVNASMVKQVKPLAERYVECVTDRGSPQPLISRFTGEAVTVDLEKDWKQGAVDRGARKPLYTGVWKANNYYPTPQMHDDGADALETVCREFIEG